jgi:hypothetical protein
MVQVTGLICVCFKRWDKDVCDPYEATPWRNHIGDTNDSRSLLNYILFNLSIEIVILSRGVQKWSLVFAKAQASIFKSYFENQILLNALCLTVVRIEKLRVFLLKSSWTSSTVVEFFFSWVKLQLSWASSATVEPFQLSWTSDELNFFNCSWAFSAVIELSQLQLNFNFNCESLWPYTSWTCLWASWTGVFSLELSGQDQLG